MGGNGGEKIGRRRGKKRRGRREGVKGEGWGRGSHVYVYGLASR